MAAQVIRIDGSRWAAGKTTRSTGGWSPADPSINNLLSTYGPSVRARVRQLVRDFPYFARAANIIVDYTVGSGIKFQSRPTFRNGRLNLKAAAKIEDAFKFWMDEADISGRLHYYEMMRLAKRQDVECGEFILVKRQVRDSRRCLPYCLQMYEADWLTSSGVRLSSKKNKLDQGVEYNSETGAVVAYHFADPDSYGGAVRVDAADVIHGFDVLRPGQLRGISPFTPGVIVTRDLQDIMDAEIDGNKMASKWLAFVKVGDPALYQQQIQAAQQPDAYGQSLADEGKRIEDLENGIIDYLRPGEDIELASNPRPSDNFPPFVRLILGMLSVSTGVPYELLSGDYNGLNYSVSRASRNDFAYNLRPIATRHIRHFCNPTFRAFLDTAVLAGKLDLKGYATAPHLYTRADWQPPGMEPVDPLKEIKANVDELKSNLRSPQEIVARRGADLEEVYQQIAAAKEMAERYGLTMEDVSTAMATNPAKLTKDE